MRRGTGGVLAALALACALLAGQTSVHGQPATSDEADAQPSAQDAAEGPAPADRPWWRPDATVWQAAGYAGLVAGGVGRDYGRDHSLALLLGYAPRALAADDLLQLTFKYEWRAMEPVALAPSGDLPRTWHPLHLGLGFVYGRHSRLTVGLPERLPEAYYPPTALRLTATVGTSLRQGPARYFVEFTALAPGISAWVKSPDYFADRYAFFGLAGVGSLGAGIRMDWP